MTDADERYTLSLSPGARRMFQIGPPKGLPHSAAPVLANFLSGPLCEDPWRVSKPLRNELEGLRGARRGDYRVVLHIDEEARVVQVVRVDHRADIYYR